MSLRKNTPFLIYIILFLLIFSPPISAKDISGTLSKGEASQFVPFQGSSFSIIRDVTSGIYGGNYDVTIKNNNKVFYHQENQVDDLYLVFNEPVDNGDIIQIEVNKGVFIFKMSHMETLPEVIIDALKKQVPKQYEKMESLHKPRKTQAVKKQTETKIQETEIIIPKIIPKTETIDDTYNKKPGFFEDLFAKINSIIAEGKAEKDAQKASIAKPTFKDDSPALTNLKDKSAPIIQKSDIDKFSSGIDQIKKDTMSVKKTIDPDITSSKIDEVAKSSKVAPPQTSSATIKDIKTPPSFTPVLDVNKVPVGLKKDFVQPKSEIETFSQIAPPAISAEQSGSFETRVITGKVEKPKFQKENELIEIKEIEIKEQIPQFKTQTVTNPVAQKEKAVVPNEPIIIKKEVKDKIIITKTIAPKEEPRVIKRHVEPEQYKADLEQVDERMSDRVKGGGYADTQKATLKVKAYSNSKAVSAWVEVFKAGSNQRVKTFYTGKGRSLKDVKLPAGVYVIKATYRTASSKRQKSLGKVTLQEGGSINKSISFDDGKILIAVTKSNKPLYAKVEVFKSGSKRRVAYEFSSRTSGKIELNLSTGRYDIVVKNHNNVKRFDEISVQGGETRVINADF